MPRRHTPQNQFHQAQVIAREHNLLITGGMGRYCVFRKTPAKPVFLGQAVDAEKLYRLVSKFAH